MDLFRRVTRQPVGRQRGSMKQTVGPYDVEKARVTGK